MKRLATVLDKVAALMTRLGGFREEKIDGYAFANRTKRANVPDSRQGLDAGNETTSSDSWNGFSLPLTCQGVTGQARFSFSIPASCHLHAWMFLAPPRGMQTCKASKIQIGFLEAKAGSKQGAGFSPSSTVTGLGMARSGCVGM